MSGGSAMLKEKLVELEQKRKSGEINTAKFYKGLLELVKTLIDELKEEQINDAQVKKQIPLILLFIKSQIKEMEGRGH